MNSRVRLLLTFAAILMVLRFVVVPWLSTQADMHDRLFAITRQLDRAEAIVAAGSELQSHRDTLAAVMQELAARAPLAIPGSDHRVRVQRKFRAVVESAGLQLKVFEWVLDGEPAATGLAFGRLRLQMDGNIVDLGEYSAFVQQIEHLPAVVVCRVQMDDEQVLRVGPVFGGCLADNTWQVREGLPVSLGDGLAARNEPVQFGELARAERTKSCFLTSITPDLVCRAISAAPVSERANAGKRRWRAHCHGLSVSAT